MHLEQNFERILLVDSVSESLPSNFDNTCSTTWTFLFCFVPKTVYGPKFFELFAKVFRIFRPHGNFFDGPNFFQNLADSAAIRLVQKSSKSEPSSPFCGRLKFRGKIGPCELLQNFLCGYKIEMAICFCVLFWRNLESLRWALGFRGDFNFE